MDLSDFAQNFCAKRPSRVMNLEPQTWCPYSYLAPEQPFKVGNFGLKMNKIGPKMGEKSDVTDINHIYVLGPKFNADYKNWFNFGVNLTVCFKFGINEPKTWNLDKYKGPTHGKNTKFHQNYSKVVDLQIKVFFLRENYWKKSTDIFNDFWGR